MGGCCKLILAWWYVHLSGFPFSDVSGFPSSLFRAIYQILCFGVIHALRCSSSFPYNVRTPIFFMLRIYASSIHALHLVSPFMYQPGFIHSCAAFCLFFHVSARLYSLMRCVLPLFSCISQASFIHALHSAYLCMYQPRSLEPPWLIFLFDMYQDKHTALCSGDTSKSI